MQDSLFNYIFLKMSFSLFFTVECLYIPNKPKIIRDSFEEIADWINLSFAWPWLGEQGTHILLALKYFNFAF